MIMAKDRQLNMRFAATQKNLLQRLSARSGLSMVAVIEYALTLVDENEIVAHAERQRKAEAESYAA
jgi:hypothetical protein